MERMYLNAHTHGIEPHPHVDDGDLQSSIILEWTEQRHFGGGTIIGNELIDYKGNRSIMFNASYLHQAQTISRQCYKLRTCVVFKTKDLDNVRIETIPCGTINQSKEKLMDTEDEVWEKKYPRCIIL